MSAEPSREAPLRVLHVSAGNLYGGIETFLRTLAEEHSSSPAMQAEFALCFEGRLASEIRSTGAPLHMLGNVRVSRPWGLVRAREKLKAVLKHRHFDVVVCHAAWPHAIFGPVVQKQKNIRLAFYRHDLGTRSSWVNLLASRTKPNIVVANSNYTEANGHPRFHADHHSMVRYVLRSMAPSTTSDRARLRASLKAANDDVVLLQASRMQSWKGQWLLVDALARLEVKTPWQCWLAGDAQRAEEQAYVEELKTKVRAHGLAHRVHFLGQRSDIAALMNAADVFIQPNAAPEPFGIVFVEALAATLPIITTDIAGGALEVVNERCSIVTFPSGDALARALQQVIEDPSLRASLSSGAGERARDFTDTSLQLSRLADALDYRHGRTERPDAPGL